MDLRVISPKIAKLPIQTNCLDDISLSNLISPIMGGVSHHGHTDRKFIIRSFRSRKHSIFCYFSIQQNQTAKKYFQSTNKPY